jgi:ABC-type lipoprotein export system ATPase subunit
MNRPSLLLCDEPTGNLDTKTSRTIGDLLHSLTADGNAMLVVVTHSTMLAESFSRRARMTDGCPGARLVKRVQSRVTFGATPSTPSPIPQA